MKKVLITTLLTMAFVSATAFYVFPDLFDFPTRIILAIGFPTFIAQLVAIWAFLTSLGVFRHELRITYYILAWAILFLSLNQLQLPITIFVPVDPIALSWGIVGSAIVGAVLLYISMYKLVQLLDIKVRLWGSFFFTLGFGLMLALTVTFIPHTPYPFDEWIIDGIFGTYVAAGGFAISAAVLAWHAKDRLAPSYCPPLKWIVARAIDTMLDEVREMTATGTANAMLSEDQKSKLLAVYKQLEDYLVTKELLLKLTKDDLRSRLPDTLDKSLKINEVISSNGSARMLQYV